MSSEYRRLSRQERGQIQILLSRGESIRFIAESLGRSPSSISREVRRNRVAPQPGIEGGPCPDYDAAHAELRAEARQAHKRSKQLVIQGVLETHIRQKIAIDWSPEQIAGRLRSQKVLPRVSHPTIYKYIYKNALYGGGLHRHLRTGRPKRRKRSKIRGKLARSYGHPKYSIEERPAVVQKRIRLGDYERDVMHGAGENQFRSVLLSIVDRTSRLIRIEYLAHKTADQAHRATVRLLKGYAVKTITNDNGAEFADHHRTARSLKTKVYFCGYGRFWERGTNENTNGLLRQYFPRNMDFRTIRNKELRRAEALLNNRPRKCLGYRTPAEVHSKRRS